MDNRTGRLTILPPLAEPRLAAAMAWESLSPPARDVLFWHMGLCRSCRDRPRCPEWHEIIADYGIAALAAV